MIAKEDFNNIIEAAAQTFLCIQKIEDAFGGVDLVPNPISDYLNKGDTIAMYLLEMKKPEDEEIDAFVQCYWNLIQEDESILTLPNKEQVIIRDSNMFYDFWARRKENFPILCEISNFHAPRGILGWSYKP